MHDGPASLLKTSGSSSSLAPPTAGLFFCAADRMAVMAPGKDAAIPPNEPMAPMDDPAAAILTYHRRIERSLAALGALCARLEWRPVDAESSGIAAGILECLGPGLAAHHADEEHDLLPMVVARIEDPAARAAFHVIRARLAEEHRALEASWRDIARPLTAVAEGVKRPLSGARISAFRSSFASHISFEEAAVQPLASRRLQPADLERLARRMRERRVIKSSFA